MLVISRRTNDSIVFPGLGITIRIVRVEGRKVRLGIEAPSDVRVLRQEIADEPQIPAGLLAFHSDYSRLGLHGEGRTAADFG